MFFIIQLDLYAYTRTKNTMFLITASQVYTLIRVNKYDVPEPLRVIL
jgi:hypothetical protein